MKEKKIKSDRMYFYSTPHSKDDSIIKRFLDQENNDPKKPILSLKEMEWKVNEDIQRSKYPYGLGKEWLLIIH